MRIPGILTLTAILLLAASGHAWAGDSLRGDLLESRLPSALYSVDDHTTAFMAEGDVASKLAGMCTERGGQFTASGDRFSCPGVFEASRIVSEGPERSFIMKTVEAQPLAYLNPSIPAVDEISELPGGRIEGGHESVDIYQMAYALCEKEQGTASVVISRRYGKFARYSEVSAEEAFTYLLTSGDGKDPWFFACEGKKRFLVEKDYQYDPESDSAFYFHPKRGLEWVEYVKADSGPLASLVSR